MNNEASLSVFIEEEYRRYANYTVMDRGMPDVLDGLSHVHRRILLGCYLLGLFEEDKKGQTTKSARVIGEVLGRLHPHGDGPTYEALVGLASPVANNYSLFNTQGDFGALSGPKSFAAMRYTEVGISQFARELFFDHREYDIETVPNYDETLQIPVALLPALPVVYLRRMPYTAIAVGTASQIPPLNLGELLYCYLDYFVNGMPLEQAVNNNITGPDFAWGGEVYLSPGAFSFGEATKFHIYPKINGDGKYFTVREIPIQEFSTSIATVEQKLKENGLSADMYIDDNESVVCEVDQPGNTELVMSILRSSFSLTAGGMYNTFLGHGGELQTMGLAEVFEKHIAYILPIVGRDAFIDKLCFLQKYAEPRRTTVLTSPYKLYKPKAAEVPITVYLTTSGVLKTTEKNGRWSPASWDNMATVVKSTNLQSATFIAENGSCRSVPLTRVLSKSSGKNGVHLDDLGYSGVVLPKTNPVLLYKDRVVRGGIARNVPFIKTVYPSNNTIFIAVNGNGQYFISNKEKFTAKVSDPMLVTFADDAFVIKVTGRVSGKTVKFGSSVLTRNQVDTLVFNEPIAFVEVV